MKRVLIAAVLLLAMGAARAQKIYFIYIQSDNNTPFFVKMGEKVTSSTASGYLIVPKLVDSTYQFTVGRTGQTASESRFSVTINKRDRGFLLREADGKLSLFDLQGMTSLQPLAAVTTSAEVIARRTDPFTVLLAQAANDPSLLEIRAMPVAVVEMKKEKEAEPETAIATVNEPEADKKQPQEEEPDTAAQTVAANAGTIEPDEKTQQKAQPDIITQAPEKKETTTVPAETEETKKTDVAKTETRDTVQQVSVTESEPVTPAETSVYKPSKVTRRSESSTSEGFGLIFWDDTNGVVDTIRIVIPNQKVLAQSEEGAHEDSKKFLDISNVDSTKTDVTVRGSDKGDVSITENSVDNVKVDQVKEDTDVATANEKIRAAEKKRKGCASEAGEREFFRLRKNMAAEETDEAMIKEAQKAFKRSCFSTEQIKNLSTLFLSASGKYHFFDAAYGYASDKEQFATLQAELRDDYYANRFKALIAQQ